MQTTPFLALSQTSLLAWRLLTGICERIHTLYVHEQNLQRELLLEQARQQRERARAEEANALAAQEKIKAEQERLRAEQAAREEQERLREIAAKKIPPLPPLPTPKPEQQQTKAQQSQPPAPSTSTAALTPPVNAKPTPPAQSILQPPSQAKPNATAAINGIAAPKPPASSATVAPIPSAPSAPVTVDAKRQRAVEIHKSLKQLRAAIASQSSQNKPLKSRAGDLRRELRKVIGQLSLDKDGNKVVVSACIVAFLGSCLTYCADAKGHQDPERGIDKRGRQPDG